MSTATLPRCFSATDLESRNYQIVWTAPDELQYLGALHRLQEHALHMGHFSRPAFEIGTDFENLTLTVTRGDR